MKNWITKERQPLKTVLRNCFMCNLVKGKFIVSPKTPCLPNFRINCSYAFESVGVDFTEPLYKIKQDVLGNTLILALRRLVAARGNPRLFIADLWLRVEIPVYLLVTT